MSRLYTLMIALSPVTEGSPQATQAANALSEYFQDIDSVYPGEEGQLCFEGLRTLSGGASCREVHNYIVAELREKLPWLQVNTSWRFEEGRDWDEEYSGPEPEEGVVAAPPPPPAKVVVPNPAKVLERIGGFSLEDRVMIVYELRDATVADRLTFLRVECCWEQFGLMMLTLLEHTKYDLDTGYSTGMGFFQFLAKHFKPTHDIWWFVNHLVNGEAPPEE